MTKFGSILALHPHQPFYARSAESVSQVYSHSWQRDAWRSPSRRVAENWQHSVLSDWCIAKLKVVFKHRLVRLRFYNNLEKLFVWPLTSTKWTLHISKNLLRVEYNACFVFLQSIVNKNPEYKLDLGRKLKSM